MRGFGGMVGVGYRSADRIKVVLGALLILSLGCFPAGEPVAKDDDPSENTPPVANSRSVETKAGESVTITLSGIDVDGDSLTFRIVEKPENGELEGEAPELVYVPHVDFEGEDSFSFVVNDGEEDSEPATVTIRVRSNTPPVADSQTIHALQSQTLEIFLAGKDLDNDPLTFRVVEGPEHGELEGNDDRWVYTPAAEFHPEDQFTFVANDGTVDSEPASVTNLLADRPVAKSLEARVNQDDSVLIVLQGSHPEDKEISFRIFEPPSNGELAKEGDGWRYIPFEGFHGSDEFRYVAEDGLQDSLPATVLVLVNGAPTATSRSYHIKQGAEPLIKLTGVDPEGDSLTFEPLSFPEHGELNALPSDRWRYIPEKEFHGEDKFTFVASDGELSSEPGVITLLVNGRPTAHADEALVLSGESVSIPINAEDPEGEVLIPRVWKKPALGTVEIVESSFVYQANVGVYGDDSFSYRVSDSMEQTSNEAVVKIAVRAKPTSEDLEVHTLMNVEVIITPKGESKDGGSLSFEASTKPEGTLLDNGDGSWMYYPPTGFTGTDNFRYIATSEYGVSSTEATVSIIVHDETFQLSGFASGILEGHAGLRLNGDEEIEVSNGSFEFSSPVFSGAPYRVEVTSSPENQLCVLDNAEGRASGDVTDISLQCHSWNSPERFLEGTEWSGSPRLAYDASGNGIAVWAQGLVSSNPTHDRPSDIMMSRYSAATELWSEPIVLNDRNPDTAVKDPKLIVGNDGEAWVFWLQSDEETVERSFVLRAAYGSAESLDWSEPMLVHEPLGELFRYGAAFSANLEKGRIVLLGFEHEKSPDGDENNDTFRVVSVESGAVVGEWHEEVVDTFDFSTYLKGQLSTSSGAFKMVSSPSGHVAAIWVRTMGFSHSRYTKNGWQSPRAEGTFRSGSIAQANSGDVLVVGAGNTPTGGLQGGWARWFRVSSEEGAGEGSWGSLEQIDKLEAIPGEPGEPEPHSPLITRPHVVVDDHEGFAVVVWRAYATGIPKHFRAVSYTESSGWLPVQRLRSKGSRAELIDSAAYPGGGALLIADVGGIVNNRDTVVLQYSKASDTWDEVVLPAGEARGQVLSVHPDGRATVLYRIEDQANALGMTTFD